MIKATELRIDNLVISKTHNGLITDIFAIFPSNIKLSANPIAIYEESDIDPIILTPEILEKAGFEDIDGTNKSIRLGALRLYGRMQSGRAYFEIPNSLYLGEIKYVHQLQNLYFALTNQELAIKL